jgi:hypothetical protein
VTATAILLEIARIFFFPTGPWMGFILSDEPADCCPSHNIAVQAGPGAASMPGAKEHFSFGAGVLSLSPPQTRRNPRFFEGDTFSRFVALVALDWVSTAASRRRPGSDGLAFARPSTCHSPARAYIARER